MIASKNNQQMKNIKKLLNKSKTRYEQRVFVVEGSKMCFEIPRDKLKQMYVSKTFACENEKRLVGYDFEIVADEVLAAVSDTKTPQGILSVAAMPQYSLKDMCAAEDQHGEKCVPLLLLLEGIQDPGNLGTMLRSGEGAGVTGIIVDQNTVDIFHPKVVRSTMGSVFRVPFITADNLVQVVGKLKSQGVSCYGTHLQGKRLYDEPNYQTATAFLIGNESSGLSDEIAASLDQLLRIPMRGQVESLNAAVATSLFLFEAFRQRRNTIIL
jgi:TrmH family RNA methyltransferase